MRLIYINYVGENYLSAKLYEFIFYEGEIDTVSGEYWDSYPADGNPKTPLDYISMVYKLETDMTIELIQNHESFDMSDCMQGVIALGWEDDKGFEDEVNDVRLFFSYGESDESVINKLYQRDLHLEKIHENEKKLH